MSADKTKEIKISVESLIYGGLAETIQHVADENEIFIDSVSAEWLDVSTHEKQKRILTRLTMTASKSPSAPPKPGES